MKKLNLEKAIDRYNGVMFAIGADHLTIGLSCSEETEKWNLRDMVSECAHQLSTYYNSGCTNYDMHSSDDEEERKAWRSETGKLSRFIVAYEPFINDLKCTEAHSSKYDNQEDVDFANKILFDALSRR